MKKIAIGHGIQNYTCASTSTASASAVGALAVLYDVTPLYPTTPRTGLDQNGWNSLPVTVLYSQQLPLNLASADGTPTNSLAAGTLAYNADPANPFPAPADLTLGGLPPVKFLGHHYFDASGTPTFDLSATGLFGSMTKTGSTNAPSGSDKGILGTGAVAWLQLADNGKGVSKGVELVYRVVTEGGSPDPCSVAGAGVQSVPYTAQYWFFA